MRNRQKLDREIRRDILRLRAQNYRQNVCAAMTQVANPMGVVGIGAQWLIKNKGLSFLLRQLKARQAIHPIWRILLGATVLARVWWKNKK